MFCVVFNPAGVVMPFITNKSNIEPAEDCGFFGPGSVTWKVWSYPTGLTVGFQRAVVVEELDPALIAAVDKTQGIYLRPRTRYDRTLRYFSMVAFGDTRSTAKAADMLVRVHSTGVGTDAITGKKYDANDPHSQLWIHLTAWHSILKAYEVFGPGPLSAEEENQYWQQCAVAAQLQTIDPADVPLSREGVREYFEMMRPKLLGSDIAKKAMNHLLRADSILPPLPRFAGPIGGLTSASLRAGTLSTMPLWMLEMGGLKQSRAERIAIRPILRAAFAALYRNKAAYLAVVKTLSPMTAPIVAPVIYGVAPKSTITMTPYEAQDLYGYERPAKAHMELRAKQAERIFSKGQNPTDEGIIESQEILGDIS